MTRWLLTLECGHKVATDDLETERSYCPACALWNAITMTTQFDDEEIA